MCISKNDKRSPEKKSNEKKTNNATRTKTNERIRLKVMTTLSDMVMQCGGGGCCVLEQCFQYPRRAREPRDCGCQFALLHRADNAWPSVHVLRSQFYLLVILYLCWRDTSVVPRLSPYLSTSTVSLFLSRLISPSFFFSIHLFIYSLFSLSFFFFSFSYFLFLPFLFLCLSLLSSLSLILTRFLVSVWLSPYSPLCTFFCLTLLSSLVFYNLLVGISEGKLKACLDVWLPPYLYSSDPLDISLFMREYARIHVYRIN